MSIVNIYRLLNCLDCLLFGFEFCVKIEFALENAIDSFSQGVLITIALSSHTNCNSSLFQ